MPSNNHKREGLLPSNPPLSSRDTLAGTSRLEPIRPAGEEGRRIVWRLAGARMKLSPSRRAASFASAPLILRLRSGCILRLKDRQGSPFAFAPLIHRLKDRQDKQLEGVRQRWPRPARVARLCL